MRAIDGDELLGIERLLDTDVVRQSKTASWLLDQVLHDIQAMPTLTPPNETPPCYQPDGDGCAYQCYDGQDEPIEKCKACPLCYSDKQRHYTPPNEPLTLDELRKGYNTPVWLSWYGDVQEWAFVRPYSKTHLEVLVFDGEADLVRIDEYRRSWVVYRRPPEGEV